MFRRIRPTLYLLLALFFLTACQAVDTSILENSPLQTGLEPLTSEDFRILQEKPYGIGRMLLTSWQDESGASCLAGTYLTPVNGQLEPHDVLLGRCASNAVFQAAYTGNSQVEIFAGAPRHTTVYGRSDIGHAVRIVWQDGQVNHIPLVNHSFLEARDGRWTVERIEVLDEENNLILAEDWGGNSVQGTN